MIDIQVNSTQFQTQSGVSVLEVCELVGVDIPRFCYHQALSVAGNCRMCLVELAISPKPVASCALPISNKIKIHVNSPLVKKARENVLEALLINHPLDCPICDQGGECDLQDQSKSFGIDSSRFFFKKRTVEDKNFGMIIKTIMTRCIHCTRCVRYNHEISGNEILGTINRGYFVEIGSYKKLVYNSEISGNVIDLCPVGALTSKHYSTRARSWELQTQESVDLSDGTGMSTYVSLKESELFRVYPKANYEINENFISDKARFSFDSNHNERLVEPFFSEKILEFNSQISLKPISNVLFDFFKQGARFNILTDNNSDFETLFFGKMLENTNLGTDDFFSFFISSFKSTSKKFNFFFCWLNNTFLDMTDEVKICFFFSCNACLENPILNLKLKTMMNIQDIIMFCFFSSYDSNLDLFFVSLGTERLFDFFEAKMIEVSESFLANGKPLIISGENLFRRGLFYLFFLNFLKEIVMASIIIESNVNSNSQSSSLLNVRNLTTKRLRNTNFFLGVNLEDSFMQKKYCNEKTYSTICRFNTHNSKIFNDCHNSSYMEIPTTTVFEEENVFLNLEQRPQKTSKVLPPINKKISSTKLILLEVLNLILFDKSMYQTVIKEHFSFLLEIDFSFEFSILYKEYTSFIAELIRNGAFFNSLSRSKKFSNIVLKLFTRYIRLKISLYPDKRMVEDSYLSNGFLKNSMIMQMNSQQVRKSASNFLV